jgi:hypothetical protein
MKDGHHGIIGSVICFVMHNSILMQGVNNLENQAFSALISIITGLVGTLLSRCVTNILSKRKQNKSPDIGNNYTSPKP